LAALLKRALDELRIAAVVVPRPKDAPQAAHFTAEVFVVNRRMRMEVVHVSRPGSRPTTGVGVGPISDEPPPDFPQERDLVGRERFDFGSDEPQTDLRLHIAATLTRRGDPRTRFAWTVIEGTLLRPAGAAGDVWTAVYRAGAERVAAQIATLLAKQSR
jgi:hypothetical protein